MLVLGIDPGIAITGFGLITYDNDGNPIAVDFGVIDGTAERDTSSRLIFLYDEISKIITRYHPTHCGIEKLFFHKNVKTAATVGEAKGVIQLCLAQYKITYKEYSPNEIKAAITSYGNADKRQVQEMVKIILGLADIPKPDDAADALAIALCHMNSIKINDMLK